MTYLEAKAHKATLEHAERAASAACRAVPGIGTGPMGLTPDSVKARRDYQDACAAYVDAFDRLRTFNAAFVRTFKEERRADQRARYA